MIFFSFFAAWEKLFEFKLELTIMCMGEEKGKEKRDVEPAPCF